MHPPPTVMRRLLVVSMIGILCTITQGAQKRRFQRLNDAAAATSTPLLQNWDFETGPFDTVGLVTGWTVNGNVGNVSAEGGTTGTHSAALGAGSYSQGDVLSQSFSTTPGKAYVLNFDSAVFGRTGSNLQLRIRTYSDSNNPTLNEIVTPPYYDSFDPAQIRFTHYQFTFTADSNATTLEFVDVVNTLPSENADVVVDSVSVAPAPPTFIEWRNTHFTAGQLGNEQICGWSADPDADGIPNGLEYYCHGDPLAGIPSSDAASLPKVTIEGPPSAQFLTCTFRRLLGWAGNDVAVDVSDDLMSWDTSGDQVEVAAAPIPSGDGVTEVAKIHLKMPINQAPITKRKFMRLRLMQ
jgi:hypothetical protein